MKTKSLLLAAVAASLGAVSAFGAVSSNVVGYTKLSLSKGFNLVANTLDNKAGNDVTALFSALPADSTVFRWNGNGFNALDKVGDGAGDWGDAGYALARRVDTDLVQLGRAFNGATVGTDDYATSAASTKAFIGSNGTTAYNSSSSNAAALTDAAIRRTIQRLDDNDAPMDGRFFLIPPSSRNTLMGLARYTEQAFVGESGNGNTIRNGEIGNLYGIPVFVSSNADTGAGNSGADRICLMGHKDAMVLVEQLAVRSQTQYKQEYLGTLFTADTIYGVKALRASSSAGVAQSSAAFALAVPA